MDLSITHPRLCHECHRRKAVFGGGLWCNKCRRRHWCDPFVEIPEETLIQYLLPHLDVVDIVSLSGVNKEMNQYFNENNIWQPIHRKKRLSVFIPRQMEKLYHLTEKTKKVEWTREEVSRNKVAMIVINETDDIPFNAYIKSTTSNPYDYTTTFKKFNRKPILPGDVVLLAGTYMNNIWVFTPCEKWLEKNPYSNVGFSFRVNALDVEEYAHGSDKGPGQLKKTTALVKRIRQPKTFHNIKPIAKKYSSYKDEFIRLCFTNKLIKKLSFSNRENLAKCSSKVTEKKKELMNLQNEIRMLEESVKKKNVKVKSYERLDKMTK